MRKRHFRYYCRMVVKTLLLILPIVFIIIYAIGSRSVILSSDANGVMTTTDTYYIPDALDGFCSFIDSFKGLSINSWYSTFLGAIGFDTLQSNFLSELLITLPLYYIWVEIFDLLLHFVLFIPDLFHKWIGGDK